MLRSTRFVFMSHCLLAQSVRAAGLAKYFPAAVKPVVQFCLDNDINMIQMPCPETLCEAGGFGRQPHGKAWYEKRGLRKKCTEIANDQAAYARKIVDAGNEILGIIGVEFSPACAVTYLNRGPVIYKDQGIYVEELRVALKERGLVLPLIGVNMRGMKKLARDLASLLSQESADQSDNGKPNDGGTVASLPIRTTSQVA